MSRLIKWDLETVRKQFQNHTHVSWTTVSAATIAWLVTERRRPSRIAVAVAIVVAHLQPMQRGLVKERLFGSSHFQPLMYILSYTLRTAGGNKKYCIVLHRSIGSISSLLPQRSRTLSGRTSVLKLSDSIFILHREISASWITSLSSSEEHSPLTVWQLRNIQIVPREN